MKEILMKAEIPEEIYNQFIRYNSIDVIIDSGNIVLHKKKIELKIFNDTKDD